MAFPLFLAPQAATGGLSDLVQDPKMDQLDMGDAPRAGMTPRLQAAAMETLDRGAPITTPTDSFTPEGPRPFGVESEVMYPSLQLQNAAGAQAAAGMPRLAEPFSQRMTALARSVGRGAPTLTMPSESTSSEQKGEEKPAPAARWMPSLYDPSRNPWSQEGQQNWKTGVTTEQQAMQEQAELASGQHRQQGDLIGQLADQIQTFDDAKRLAEARRMEEQRGKEQEIGRLIEDVQTSKVDPGRLWGSSNTMAQIGAALAIAVTGFAEGMSGKGGNSALDRLNGLIDKDIDAQKGIIDNKKAALMGKRTLLGEMRQRFGDERQAEMATRIAMREYAGMRAQQLAEASGSEMVMAQAKALQGQMQQKNALETRQLIDLPNFVPAHMVGVVPAQKSAGDTYVPYFGGNARSKEDAEKLRTSTASGSYVLSELGKIRQRAEKIGAVERGVNKVYETQDVEDLKNAADALAQPIVQMMGGGAAAEAEAARSVKNILGSLRVGRNASEVVAQEEARIRNFLDQQGRQYGLRGAQEGYAVDQRGQLTPTSQYTGQTMAPRSAVPKSFNAAGKK